MKMYLSLLLLVILAFLLPGCQSVPATEIGIDRKTGALRLKSPKDLAVEGVEYERRKDGSVVVKVKSYKSKNSAEVIASIAESNAKTMAQNAALMERVLNSAAAGAAEALVPVPTPPTP